MTDKERVPRYDRGRIGSKGPTFLHFWLTRSKGALRAVTRCRLAIGFVNAREDVNGIVPDGKARHLRQHIACRLNLTAQNENLTDSRHGLRPLAPNPNVVLTSHNRNRPGALRLH